MRGEMTYHLLQNLLRIFFILLSIKKVSSPVTGLEWPRGLQEVKIPKYHENGRGWW